MYKIFILLLSLFVSIPNFGRTILESSKKDGQSVASSINQKDIFIEASLSKNNIYLQDAVTISYSLYFKSDINISDVALEKKPDFQSVISQTISYDTAELQIKKINNQLYKMCIIGQYILYPQTSGDIILPPISYSCSVLKTLDQKTNNYTIKKVHCTSNSIILSVKPLPTPIPSTFSQGVGQFSLSHEILTPNLRTNELGTVRIILRGTGNLRLISAPKLNLPKGIEIFPPKIIDKTQIINNNISGEIWYEYNFIPHNKGELNIPPLTFSYFNIHKNQYKTLTTHFSSIKIAQGIIKKLDNNAEKLHPQKEGYTPTSNDTSFFIEKWFFIPLVIFILSLGPIILYLEKTIKFKISQSKDKIKATHIIEQLNERYNHTEKDIFIKVSQEQIKMYLLYSLDFSKNTNKTLKDLIETDKIPQPLRSEIQEFIDKCNFIKFSPEQDLYYNDLLKDSINIILSIEKLLQV